MMLAGDFNGKHTMQLLFALYCKDLRMLVIFEEKGGNPLLNLGVGYFSTVKMLNNFYVKKIVHDNVGQPMPDIVLGKPVNRFHTLL